MIPQDPPGYRIVYGDDDLLHVVRIWNETEVGDGFPDKESAVDAALADADS